MTKNKNGFLPKLVGLALLSVMILLLGAFANASAQVTASTEPISSGRIINFEPDFVALGHTITDGCTARVVVGSEAESTQIGLTFSRTSIITFSVADGQGTLVAMDSSWQPIVSGQALLPNAQIRLNATPALGYQVARWYVDGEYRYNGVWDWTTNTSRVRDELVVWFPVNASSMDVTVVFEPVSREVHFNYCCGVTATVNGNAIESGDSVQEGSTVIFTAIPPAGHIIYSWYVWGNGTLSGNDTDMVRSLVVGDSDIEICVCLDLLPPHSLIFDIIGGQGELEARMMSNGTPLTSGQVVNIHEDGVCIAFTAIPAEGYHLAGWIVNGEYLEHYEYGWNLQREWIRFVSGWLPWCIEYEGLTVIVLLERDPPSVVFWGNSSGDINAEVNGVPLAIGQTVPIGTIVTFTPIPRPGFRFVRWLVDGENVGTDEVLSIKVEQDIHVSAVFELIPDSVEFYVVGGQGTLTARFLSTSEPIISGQTPVQTWEQVVFTATPAEGYRIASWTRNGSSGLDAWSENTWWGSRHVTVTFEPLPTPRTITFYVADGNGTLRASYAGFGMLTSGQTVLEGASVRFTASPSHFPDYRVASWNITGGTLTGDDSDLVRYIVVGEEDIVVTVTFELRHTEYIVHFGVAGGQGIITATSGFLQLTSGVPFPPQNSLWIRATPAEGYRIARWEGNIGPTDPWIHSMYFSGGVNGIQAFVVFEPIPMDRQRTVNFSAIGGQGTIDAVTTSGHGPLAINSGRIVEYGASVGFTATPAEGYRLVGWHIAGATVTANASDAARTVRVEANTTVTAMFAPIAPAIQRTAMFTVAEGQGTITASVGMSPSVLFQVNSGEAIPIGFNNVTFEAIPAEGYRIARWTRNGNTWAGTPAQQSMQLPPSNHFALTITVGFEPINPVPSNDIIVDDLPYEEKESEAEMDLPKENEYTYYI